MTLATATADLKAAHHLAATAMAHGNWCAWRFLHNEERRIRRLIASGQTQDRIDGGSPADLSPAAGDHGTPWETRTPPVLSSPSSMPTRKEL